MKYCLSTVVYPAAKHYVPEFLGSAVKIMAGHSIRLVIFCHGHDPVFPDNSENVLVQKVSIPEECSIADVRAHMFAHLKQNTDDEIYIFTDCDDRLHPQAFDRHRESLKGADFSYGDQHLFLGGFDHDLETTLFSCMNPPDCLNRPEDLLRGNCVGLSALAMSRRCLLHMPDVFPENIPPLDWWLTLKLLELGMKGARAEVVTDYRLSEDAYGRIFKPVEAAEIQAKARHVLDVLQDLKGSERVLALRQRLVRLIEGGIDLGACMKEVSDANLMWYQDVINLADCMAKLETGKAKP